MGTTDVRLVDIPSYTKVQKNGKYYALKKDMPYFADEENVRGHIVIGEPSDVPGKMIPNMTYDWYCTSEAVERKAEGKRKRREAEEAARRKEEEETAELERNMGIRYIPLERTWEDLSCHPINGFLAEKFFEETGLSTILEEVLGPGKAFLIKLSSAVLATGGRMHLEFGALYDYPMKSHMLFEMNRFLTMSIWVSITDDEVQRFTELWIEKTEPQKVSSNAIQSTITLFHNEWSDRYGDGGWFVSRVRTGTRYHPTLLLYRDGVSGKLVAFEHLQYEPTFSLKKLNEIYTIKNSVYPALRGASLHFFLPAYMHIPECAVGQIPITVCMHVSDYSDKKEIKAKLKELEAMQVSQGVRMLRWKGTFKNVEGEWILLERPDKRSWMVDDVRGYLRGQKRLLQSMSYYPACEHPTACYFDIEQEGDDGAFFDNEPFTVRNAQGAAEKLRQDAGRYLYFSSEEPLKDQELQRLSWCEDDLSYHYRSFINHGETTDITNEFWNGCNGRELPLFIAAMYREWIYDHIGDQFSEEWDVDQFADEARAWSCDISRAGEIVATKPLSKRMRDLLARFGVSEKDMLSYMKQNVRQEKYCAEEYEETW